MARGCVKFYLKSLVIDINYRFHNLISRLKTHKNNDQTQISLLSCLKSLLLISIATPLALPLTSLIVCPARKLYYSLPNCCMDYVSCSLSHKYVGGYSGYSLPSLNNLEISCFNILPGGILFVITYAPVTNSKEFSFIKY